MARRTPRSPWNTARMDTDRLLKGWNYTDIATKSGLSLSTVTRFFDESFQSPKSAKKIARALGHPLSRYVKDAEVAA